MGSWGTGIHQNDMAGDVKMIFQDFSRRPTDVDTLVTEILEKFDVGKGAQDESEADVWLALADILHQHALDHSPTMIHAKRLIEDGTDLAIKRDLGMSERDLAKREKVLAETLDRWSKPHPKPKKRKKAPAPEPFLLEVGDVWAYPTMHHAARPFHVKDIDLSGFVPDGWGAFAVADRWHANGHRACYLFVLVIPDGTTQPTLEQVHAAPLQECTYTIEGYDKQWIYPVIFEGRLAKRKQGLKQWGAELLGSIALDVSKVREHFPDRMKNVYNAFDPDGFLWLEDELTTTSFHKAASNARAGTVSKIVPHPSLRLATLCTD